MKNFATILVLYYFVPNTIFLLFGWNTSNSSFTTSRTAALADQALVISFDVPGELNQCADAEIVTVTVENITDDTPPSETVANIRGKIDLPSGVIFQNFNPQSSGATYSALDDSIRLLDLAAGASITFSFEIQADCDFSAADFATTFSIVHDETTLTVPVCSTATGSSALIEGQSPVLGIPSADGGVFTLNRGETQVVNAMLSNSGDGTTNQLEYCLEDNGNAILTQVQFTGPEGSVTLMTGVNAGGETCFTLGAAEFIGLFNANEMPAGSTIAVQESWKIIDCGSPVASVLRRRVQAGCLGDSNCENTSFADYPGTAINIMERTKAISLTIDAPDQLTQCGPVETVTVTIEHEAGVDDIISGLRGLFDIDPSTGIQIVDFSGPITIDAGTDSIRLTETLDPGETLTFTIDLRASCGFEDGLGSINFAAIHDPVLCVQNNGETTNSENINYETPDLSLVSLTPIALNTFPGATETITARVVNAGNGNLDTMYYCVAAHPNATLSQVSLGGVVLPVAFVQGSSICYLVGPDEIAAAEAMGAGSNITVDGLFGDEAFDFVETWVIDNCDNANPPDLFRKVQFGCLGDLDCEDRPIGEFRSAGLLLGNRLPDLDLSIQASGTMRPACFGDDLSPVEIVITNNGDAPATDIQFQISSGANSDIDLSNYNIAFGAGGNPTDQTAEIQVNAACAGVFASITDNLDGLTLAAGESLVVRYDLAHGCGGTDCAITDIYESTFEIINYNDPCGDQQENESISTTDFSANIRSFEEAPAILDQGEKAILEYVVTGISLPWFNGDYPNAVLESKFAIPCGLDFQAGSMAWIDRDGTSFTPTTTTVVENAIGDVDSVYFTWEQGDRPSGFSIQSGSVFTICVVNDCSEDCADKPGGVCTDVIFPVVISQETDLIIDPSCTNCKSQTIWNPNAIEINLTCPPDQACPGDDFFCLDFQEFNIERTNFGMPDQNNDQTPNGLLVDNLLQKDRFLSGDTLKATFEGRVIEIGTDRDIINGYATLPFVHSNFNALSASVQIFDEDGGVYQCNALPITPDFINNTITVDFSRDTLRTLGCTSIPMNFDFDNQDSIVVCLLFESKDLFTGMQRTIDYEPDFFLSPRPLAEHTNASDTLACGELIGRMTQIGIMESTTDNFASFGSCDLPNWRIITSKHYGADSFDEFPYEVRKLGLPKTITFNKPSEFPYRTDAFSFTLQQRISGASGGQNIASGTIPSSFLTVTGNQVIYQAEQHLLSLNNDRIIPDEGFRFIFRPAVQGACTSTAGSYPISYDIDYSVDANVFCTPILTDARVNDNFNYDGGAEIEVNPVLDNILLCNGNDTILIEVNNISTSTAPNSFLHVESPSGGIIVTELYDINSGQVIQPNAFGVYPIGDLPQNSNLPLRVAVRANICEPEALQFTTGWDCENTPTVVDEAICQFTSFATVSSAPSGLNLDILFPTDDTVVDLCETFDYEVEIRSTNLGFLRDIFLNAQLPASEIFIPGSMMFANPAIDLGGTYINIPDPVMVPGGFRLDVSALDPILEEEGLIGSKDLNAFKVNIKFSTRTDCGYISPSQASFFVEGSSTCGDPLSAIAKAGPRILVEIDEPAFEVDITASDLTMNPCNGDTETLTTALQVTSGSTAALDSIRYTLPPGIEYVPNSYEPLLNATPGEPVITTNNGLQILSWPFGLGLSAGQTVSFRIDIEATDVSQICTDYTLNIQAFTSFSAFCPARGEICDFGQLAGGVLQPIRIDKPILDFDDFSAAITLTENANLAEFEYEITVCNSGDVLLDGNTVQVDIYEDSDNNGVRSPGDIFLFSVEETLTEDFTIGSCITISGMETFVPGAICTIIGVLDPNNTCVCSEIPSAQVRPSINLDFTDEVETCSAETVSFGPMEINNYDYTWLPVNGSDTANLSTSTSSPTSFASINQTNAPIETQFALLTSTGSCFTLDTMTIVIFPENSTNLNITACEGSSLNLPSPNVGGRNFVWSSYTNLTFNGPDSSFATLDPVPENPVSYSLTFEDGNGCPVVYNVNIQPIDCGIANTALGDTVWFDFDQNGLQDLGEPGIEGVVVNLYSASTGTIIGTTVTDENGFYIFDELPSASYFVEFVPLPGFIGTVANAGSGVPANDELDSDANALTGRTNPVFLPINTYNPTIDAGFIPNCSMELEVDVNECMPSGDDLVRNVEVTVRWDGNPYTYDQFVGYGQDELVVNFLGTEFTFQADTLFGEETFSLEVSNLAATTAVNATAAFTFANTCTAEDLVTTIEPCLFDLALKKVSTNGNTFKYGDTIDLEIIVYNQGVQPATNITVIDYLPAGFKFLPAINNDWTQISGGNLTAIITNTLETNQSDTIPLQVEFVMTNGGANDWLNRAEITGFEDVFGNDRSDFDEDSQPDNNPNNDPGGNPGTASDNVINGNGTGTVNGTSASRDEDDADPFRVNVFDLALVKRLVTPPPYAYGQTLTFEIELSNQGNVTAQNIQVTDYIPEGFAWNTTNEPIWTFSENGTPDLARRSIVGPLLPGQQTSVTVQLDLQQADPAQYVNRAEISFARDGQNAPRFDDVDSTPNSNPIDDAGGQPGSDSDDVNQGNGTGMPGDEDPATDEDDADPAYVPVPIINVEKTVIGIVAASSGTTGNFDVTFEMVVDNPGNIKLIDLELNDNLVQQFGASFIRLVTAPQILAGSTAETNPTLDPAFNGASNIGIFNGDDGCLRPRQNIIVQMTVELTNLGGVTPLSNRVTTVGVDTIGTPTDDEDEVEVIVPNCFLDVVCPIDQSYTCSDEVPGLATTVAEFNALDAFSAVANSCGMVSIVGMETRSGDGCVASPLIITHTYTINDAGGNGGPANSASCTVTYTVIDDEQPLMVCPPAPATVCTVDELPVYNSVAEFTAAGGLLRDNCTIQTLTLSMENSDGGTCPEVVTRIYQATDACGNISTCNQVIQVNDIIPPQMSCPPIRTSCFLSDIPVYSSLQAFLDDGNTASDNCGLIASTFMLVEEDTDNNSCPQIVTRKYSVMDACGNIATSKQIITIDDEQPPVFTTFAEDLNLSCEETIPAAPELQASDNCATPTITFTETSTQTDFGLCSDHTYTIVRTWTATDRCGNAAVETQTISVTDVVAPTPVCADDFSVSIGDEADGVITLNGADLDDGSFDNCTSSEDLTFTVSPSDFTLLDLGDQVITLTVTDVCGNVATCTTTVTITEEPVIGLAKRAVEVVDNPDGTATVVYEFNVQNYGNVPLADLQVVDDLSTTFGDCTVSVNQITSDDYKVNANFGTGTDWNLLGGEDTLRVSDKGAILLTLTIDACTDYTMPFVNTANVSGLSPGGVTVQDRSTDGSNPDPNGDGLPGDDAEDSVDTEISLNEAPSITIDKRLVYQELRADGSYLLEYELAIENTGDMNIEDLQVVDDLSAVFPGTCIISARSSSNNFTDNIAYGTGSDWNLLSGINRLDTGMQASILLTVELSGCESLGSTTNTASVSGSSPRGTAVADSDTEVVVLTENPSIGLAKRVVEVENNGDGSFEISYELNVQNYGDVAIAGLQIVDNLATTFANCTIIGTTLSSDDFSVAPDYGVGNSWELLNEKDTLGVGDKGAVLLKVTVEACTDLSETFSNNATVSGSSPAGTDITDASVNGSDPDPDGDGTAADDMSGTPVSFEVESNLGLAKRVSAGPANNGDGTYTLTYEFRLSNRGNIALDNLSLRDTLSKVFGTDCAYQIDELRSDEFAVNTNYDGEEGSDVEILAEGNTLKSWDEGAVYLTITAGPCNNLGTFENSAVTDATTPDGTAVADTSQVGSEADPDGDGDPTNNNEVTSFELTEDAVIGMAKRLVSVLDNPDGSAFVSYEFNLQNYGNVPLSAVLISDPLDAAFPDCEVTISSITSDDYIINDQYGINGDWQLLSGVDTIQPSDKGAVLLTILVDNCDSYATPFENNATVSGRSPSGVVVTDESNPGADPDPDGDGDPTNDTGGTDVVLEENPQITVDKRTLSVVRNDDGTFVVEFDIRLINTGNTDILMVQAVDNLENVFPMGCTLAVQGESEEFDYNDDFGTASDWDLLEGTDVLETGDAGSILLTVTLSDCASLGEFENTVVVSGVGARGTPVGAEDSSDGTLDINPRIGIAKRIAEVTSNEDGSYTLVYEFNVENFGDVDLTSVQIVDDLTLPFTDPCAIEVLSVTSDDFSSAANYGPDNGWQLLTGTDLLPVQDKGAVLLKVRIDSCSNLPATFQNQAMVTADGSTGEPVTDISVDGSDPDPGEDGEPEESSFTEVDLGCTVSIICPAVPSTITVENDAGWCQAVVNLPPATAFTCAGNPPAVVQYYLEGVGAQGVDLETWIEGQPSGLSYLVGTTTVRLRAIIPGLPSFGTSDTCLFDIVVLDKEAPQLVCQDITVPVGENCEFSLSPERIDAGATDNCTSGDNLVREIRLTGGTYSTDPITFDRTDLINTPITVFLRVTDEAGNSSECTVEVNLEDRTEPDIVCPEPMDIVIEDNLCAGTIPDLMAQSTIDNCAAIDTVYQNPRPGLLFGSAHNDFIDVVLTVVDINGNQDSCAVRLTLKDETNPEFLNCTRPDIRVNTLPGMCAAFVNFELPEAIDNCEVDRIEQNDNSGLTTGDMFPVGTTILEYTAYDIAGNLETCSFRVIVNDKAPPIITCPVNQTVSMDAGDCGALVANIAPISVEDNCIDNVAVTYKVENDGNLIEAGIADASDLFFPGGINTVTYRAQDQPLFLITEVTQDIGALDGGNASVPSFITDNVVDPNGDYLEVSNLGPAALDISTMIVQRIVEGGTIETLMIPNSTILPVGGVLTIHFGTGTDDPVNFFFNVPTAINLTPSQRAAYVLAHSGAVLDVAAINDFNPTGLGDGFTVSANDWSDGVNGGVAGIIRKYEWDSNTAEDFFTGLACDRLSIGTLNSGMSAFPDNGTTTSLQAQAPLIEECSFTIIVEDNEAPECGMYSDPIVTLSSDPTEDIAAGECYESIINVADAITIADVNVKVAGTTATMSNLRMTLISPEGTAIELWNQDCGAADGWDITFDSDSLELAIDNCAMLGSGEAFRPVGSLEDLIGEEGQGIWVLQISNAGETNDPITLTNWELAIRGQEAYVQDDIAQNNDVGVCGAEVTWVHPVYFDNCPGGILTLTYLNADDNLIGLPVNVPRAEWGTEISRSFDEGVTKVLYTLKDAAGNEATCAEFTVTIIDNEDPIIVACPADITRQLTSGECEILLDAPMVSATDNCGIATISFDPPFTMPFEIGTTEVTVKVTDVNGNMETCTFNVIVNGFEPTQVSMSCFDAINVTLNQDCEAVITPGMILSGNNYRCFDDYNLVLKYGHEPNDPIVETSPYLNLSHVGRDIFVVVQDPVTGTICWGKVNVDHKRTPDFEIPNDTILACNAIDTGDVSMVLITSCIDGEPVISFYDEIIEDNGECGNPLLVIRRTWRVEDSKGRFAEKEQKITYEPFDLADLAWPVNYVNETALSCIKVAEDPSLLSPDSLGYPTLDNNLPIFNNTDFCRFSFSYKDHRLEICEGSYEIIRTWTIRNLCEDFDETNPVTHRQLIQVLDKNAPIFDCQEDVVISTSPFDCTAAYVIPEPVLMDSCSSVTWDVSLGGAGSLIYDDSLEIYTVYDLPVGIHTVTYRAVDDCGRRASCSYKLIVEDLVKPIVRCDDELRVTLVEGDPKLIVSGYAFYTAGELDEGTTDNCQLDSLHVRRLIDNLNTQSDWEAINGRDLLEEYEETDSDYNQGYTGWDEIVEFFCGDLAGPVRVEMRAMDSSGNTSICWMDVEVENGTNYNVNIQPEGDLQVTCDEVFNAEDHFNINLTGLACGASAISHTVIPELDQCGIGRYKIAFEVLGAESKNEATIIADTITVDVVAVHDYWIKFPADEVYECGSDQVRDSVEVSALQNNACDLIAIATLPDQRFNASSDDPDACYKILRTYQVINWCEYDGQANPVIVSRDWDAHNANGNDCNLNPVDNDPDDGIDDDDTRDVGEYNLNPQEPDGDGVPGNTDLYVIVDVNNSTGRGIVYYDNDSDPTNTSTANLFGDDDNNDPNSPNYEPSSLLRFNEGYWWAVTREPDCQNRSTWFDAGGTNEGSDAQDDNDNQYGSNGFWQYTQHIIVKDNTAPTAEIISEPIAAIDNINCAVDSSFIVQISDECSLFDIIVSATVSGVPYDDVVISGDPDSLLIATVSGQFSIGEHIVEITTTDGCGNASVTTDTLVILDGKAPAPICENGIVAELMPTEGGDAMAVVWASDFIASPIGDCTGQGENDVAIGGSNTQAEVIPDAYSIYIEDSVAVAGDTFYISPFADESVRGVTLTCANLGGLSESVVNVRVYAEDGQGNKDYCRTFIRLQDNLGTCGNPAGTGMIAGLISSEDVNPIANVEVQLSGAASTVFMTKEGGDYVFDRLVEGNDFTVTPSKDIQHKNGVSTLDLIQIQKHILGRQIITSPYKLIAADANNSRSVTTLDMIQIRKLILNLDPVFENNASWRFVDEAYEFPDPSNPWLEAFPEVRNINNLDGTVLANFVGIKIGDVNGSANLNEPRSYEDVMEISTQELEMERGNIYTVSFKTDMTKIEGYQFTMDFDLTKVEILEVKEGIAKAENFGVFTEAGSITTSYNRDLGTTPELEGDVLFSLSLRAKEDAALSEVIGLSSRLTEAEAYQPNNDLIAVGLVIDQATVTDGFILYQNTPNPFEAETMIGFKLPEAMEGVLEFKDISGRTILLKEGSFTKGYNEVRLRANELPAAGVYFYTLQAGQFTATKKMILVNR